MAKVFLVNLGKCDHTYLISEISQKDILEEKEVREIKHFRKCICNLSSQGPLEPVKSKILSMGKEVCLLPVLSGDHCSSVTRVCD